MYSINANAEVLRDKFVSHTGKKNLVVSTPEPIDQADFGSNKREGTWKSEPGWFPKLV